MVDKIKNPEHLVKLTLIVQLCIKTSRNRVDMVPEYY